MEDIDTINENNTEDVKLTKKQLIDKYGCIPFSEFDNLLSYEITRQYSIE